MVICHGKLCGKWHVAILHRVKTRQVVFGSVFLLSCPSHLHSSGCAFDGTLGTLPLFCFRCCPSTWCFIMFMLITCLFPSPSCGSIAAVFVASVLDTSRHLCVQLLRAFICSHHFSPAAPLSCCVIVCRTPSLPSTWLVGASTCSRSRRQTRPWPS